MLRAKMVGLIKKGFFMIIIGFSCKTHLPIVRLVCRHFKHCAVIVRYKNRFVLHQFAHCGNVAYITISAQGIKRLRALGWVFICIKSPQRICFNKNAKTCVNYVKHAVGIKKFWIQTPDALFRYLKKSDKNVRFFLFYFRTRLCIKSFFPNLNYFIFIYWGCGF